MVSKAAILAAFIAMVAAAPIEPASEISHDLYAPISDTTYRPAVFRIVTKKSDNAPEFDAPTVPSWYPPAKFGKREDGSKGNNPEIYAPPFFYVTKEGSDEAPQSPPPYKPDRFMKRGEETKEE